MRGNRLILRNTLLIIILFIIFCLMIYSYWKGGLMRNLVGQDIGGISEFIRSFGFLAIFVFIILVIIEVVIAPLPSVVLYAVGGAVFGTFIGGTAALVGNIIGAAIDFKIAEKYGRGFVRKRINAKKMEQFDRFSEKYGGLAIFLLRINPFTSSDIFSYLAGLSKISMLQLMVGTGLGLLPLTYLQAYLGESVLVGSLVMTLIFIFVSIAYVVIFFYGFTRMKK